MAAGYGGRVNSTCAVFLESILAGIQALTWLTPEVLYIIILAKPAK